ncbi:MAG TPA: monovalent cation/H(+) antiporter subunit G [Ilumatobacteraceae bacterium]|nr:monovalent cation/H(+) antiporter subunit G [Ilumatobacteraceae bacterium]
MIELIAAAFLVSGTAFLMISALGLMRFPDFWTRAHAVAKAETLGLVLVFIGLIVLNRFGPGSLQLALIAGFSLLVNPTAIHALARSALRGGTPADEVDSDSSSEPHGDAEGSP